MNAMEVLKSGSTEEYACLQKGSDAKGTIFFVYLCGKYVVVDKVAASKYWKAGPKKQITLAERKKLKVKVPAGMKLHSFTTKKLAGKFFDELINEKLDAGFKEFTPH